MAKKIEVKITVTGNDSDHKAYDNRIVKPGEVLAPMMAFDDRISVMDIDKKNIRTRYTAGKKYKVIFYPVPEECFKEAKAQFNSELNEFLGKGRDARCLVPQEDGSVKLCPKKNGDNRPTCVDCPHNGEYQREVKVDVSLDYLVDEFDYEPEAYFTDLDAVQLKADLDDLIKRLEAINQKYAKIVRLGKAIGTDGNDLGTGDKKELVDAVIRDLGINKSQAYHEVNAALKAVKKLLDD